MPGIPTPPPDLSGGYMITTYTNGTDTHRQRFHLRPFTPAAAFVSPFDTVHATVPAEWTALYNLIKALTFSNWTFSLTSIFLNNGDGTFTELFGWTPPTPIAGTVAGSSGTDQARAMEQIFNFRDGFGGRMRVIMVGQVVAINGAVPQVISGAPAGTNNQQLVDYLTNQSPVKSNVVSHGGHALQSPARETFCVNRRLRRHYGFA